jgi:hypothetical protein
MNLSMVEPGTQTNDLAGQIAELQVQLDEAERARVNPADVKAARVRAQLAEKQRELKAVAEIESQAVAQHQRKQELLALEEIENDCRAAKATLDTLKSEQAQLPDRIRLAEFNFSQLLRACAEARRSLGV